MKEELTVKEIKKVLLFKTKCPNDTLLVTGGIVMVFLEEEISRLN